MLVFVFILPGTWSCYEAYSAQSVAFPWCCDMAKKMGGEGEMQREALSNSERLYCKVRIYINRNSIEETCHID